jgi:hypothetical protein
MQRQRRRAHKCRRFPPTHPNQLDTATRNSNELRGTKFKSRRAAMAATACQRALRLCVGVSTTYMSTSFAGGSPHERERLYQSATRTQSLRGGRLKYIAQDASQQAQRVIE